MPNNAQRRAMSKVRRAPKVRRVKPTRKIRMKDLRRENLRIRKGKTPSRFFRKQFRSKFIA